MEYPRYIVVEGIEILQGDILASCPIVVPDVIPPIHEGETATVEGRIVIEDVIVLTQSCDLTEGKVERALVCPLVTPDELLGNKLSSAARNQFMENLRKGLNLRYHLLAACELEDLRSDNRIVDFGSATGMPLGLLIDLVRNHGRRVRLQPPYREHLSQAFGRFFMRVGLPEDIPPFK